MRALVCCAIASSWSGACLILTAVDGEPSYRAGACLAVSLVWLALAALFVFADNRGRI